MKDKYIRIPVTIQIKEDSDIHKRLLRLAEASGTTLESMLEFLVRVGVDHHLRLNIKRMETELGIAD